MISLIPKKTKFNHCFKKKINIKYTPKFRNKFSKINSFIETKQIIVNPQLEFNVNKIKQNKLKFGNFAITVASDCNINSTIIRTLNLTISRFLKKSGRFWLRVTCNSPVSAKPLETRMGKGKGSIKHWVAYLKAGSIIYEFSGLDIKQFFKLFKKIQYKLHVQLNFLVKMKHNN